MDACGKSTISGALPLSQISRSLEVGALAGSCQISFVVGKPLPGITPGFSPLSSSFPLIVPFFIPDRPGALAIIPSMKDRALSPTIPLRPLLSSPTLPKYDCAFSTFLFPNDADCFPSLSFLWRRFTCLRAALLRSIFSVTLHGPLFF